MRELSKGEMIMTKESLYIDVNDVNFYCEKRGSGPSLMLVPDGTMDCEIYSKVGDMLTDEFTVLTYDVRGATRSMPTEHKRVTPQVFASDVAEIIKALDMAPAAIYGSSMGGQAVLSVGKYYPEVARNLIVHEAALMRDVPIPNTGFEFFNTLFSTFGPLCDGFSPRDVSFICNWDNWKSFGDDFLKRFDANNEYWAKYYLGTIDVDTYTKEDLEIMPNLEFSVGAWSPYWMVYANMTTAKRGGNPCTLLPGGHVPQCVCLEEFVDFLRKTCRKYL